MVKKWIYLLIALLSVNICSAIESHKEYLHPWQVCPVNSYQPDLSLDALTCHELSLPSPWEEVMPDYDGFAVFINQFEAKQLNNEWVFYASQIRDADKVFINGHLIGEMGSFPPDFQKAVLYSRTYQIPSGVIQPSGINDIVIWVYNDARIGGFVKSQPLIATQEAVAQLKSDKNLLYLFIIVTLVVVAVMHLLNYQFNRHFKANLSYGLFLLVWAAYLWTYSDFALSSGLSINTLFKLNVVLFFCIFIMFPVFILQFFNTRPSLALKTVIAITALCIPVVLVLPAPGMAYVPLQLVEIMTIPAIWLIFGVFKKAIEQRKPYAKLMVFVLVIYIGMGCVDILVDFFELSSKETDLLLGPWAVLLLSIVLTMILAHKNSETHHQATTDVMTGAMRLSEFLHRLDDLKTLAKINKQSVLVVMLDIDEFKKINDEQGHEAGDRVLQQVVKQLSKIMDAKDLIGRYGGDEFCLACLMEKSESVTSHVEKLHKAAQKVALRRNNERAHVGITMGAYVSSYQSEESSKEMVKRADLQLIQGKVENKGGITGC